MLQSLNDLLGVGVNSDKIYKLCNNTQLLTAQHSNLGVDLKSSVVSSIGYEDDFALMSDSLLKLAGLLHLTKEYCRQFHVELVPEKTKLLAFCPPQLSSEIYLHKIRDQVLMGGKVLEFSSSAEHVGILRSTDGNMPNILARLSAHTRAIMSVLPIGMACSHRGNPDSSLRLEKLYGTPVLLSGLPALPH